MIPAVPDGGKSHRAESTMKRLLACVSPQVYTKVPFLRKYLPTVREVTNKKILS